MDIVKASENLIDLAPSQNPQDPIRPQGPAQKTQEPGKPTIAPTVPVFGQQNKLSSDPSLDSLVEERKAEDYKIFSAAVDKNPEEQAKVIQIARDLGIDSGTLAEHPEVVDEYLKRREFENINLSANSPVVAQAFRNPSFASIASDEARNLSLWEQLYGAFTKGQLETEKSQLASEWMESANTGKPVPASVRARLDEIKVELKNPRFPQDILEWYERPLEQVASFVGQQSMIAPKAIAGGAVTGTVAALGAAAVSGPVGMGPAFAEGFKFGSMAMSGLQTYDMEAGNAFLSMVAQGVPEKLAAEYAPTVGGINAVIEIGLMPFSTKAVRGLLGDIGKSAMKGVVSEAIDEASKNTSREIAKRFAKDVIVPPMAESIEEFGQGVTSQIQERRAIQANAELTGQPANLQPFDWSQPVKEGLSAFVSIGVLNTPVARVRAMRAASNLRTAQNTVKAVENIAKAQEELKLPSRDLPSYLQLAMQIAKINKVENIYLSAVQAVKALEELQMKRAEKIARERGVDVASVFGSMPSVISELSSVLGIEAQQLQNLVSQDQDIVIPTEQYAHKIVNTDLEQAFKMHIRADENAVSLAEAQEDVEKLKGQIKELSDKSIAKQLADKVFSKSAHAVEDHFVDVLKNLLKEDGSAMFDAKDAKTMAVYLRDMFSMLAVRLNVSPEEVLVQYPYKIQSESMQPGQRGSFDPTRLLASINNTTGDWTTLTHETAHFYQHVLFDMVRQNAAPQEVLDDVQTLLAWFGDKDLAAYDALTPEQREQRIESFAHNYEKYFAEAKAPTRGLQGLYRRIKDFFKRTYLSLTQQVNDAYKAEYGVDLPVLTGEVRAVMDRMLASNEQVKLALEVEKMMPMFQTQEESGMNDADWKQYQKWQQDQLQLAIDDLDQKSYLAARHVSNLKNKLLIEMRAKEKELRDAMRVQVEKELAELPINRAISFLRGEGAPVDWKATQKLNLDAVDKLFANDPKLLEKIKDKLGIHARGMLGTVGLSPLVAADMLGFKPISAKKFVMMLYETPTFDEQVESVVEQRMLQQHTDLVDPKKREQAIDRAIHNRAELKFVAAELGALIKSTQPVRVMLAAAKAVAEERLADAQVGRISPKRFMADAIRASRRALQALKEGDVQGAIEAKRNELILQQMHLAAIDAVKEREKAIDSFKRFSNPNKSVRNMDDVRIARAILGMFGIGPMAVPDWDAEINLIRDNDPELWANKVVPLIDKFKSIKFASPTSSWKDMSLDNFQYLKAVVDGLWTKANRDATVVIDGKQHQTQDFVDRVVGSLDSQKLSEFAPAELGSLTSWQRSGLLVQGWLANSTRMEHLVYRLDGGKVGVWTEMFRTVRNKLVMFNAAKRDFDAKYKAILEKYEHLLVPGKIVIPGLRSDGEDYVFGRGTNRGMHELLGCLAHTGNELSYAVNLITRKWGEIVKDELGNARVDDSRWTAAIEKLISDEVLTKEHFDFVSEILQHVGQLKQPAQQAHHEVTGDYMEEVKPRKIVNSLGEWEGGYFPAGIDRLAANLPSKPTTIETRQDYVTKMLPLVEKGWSIKRVANRKEPLLFDLHAVTEHFDDVLRYIYLQKSLSDVNRIMNNEEVSSKVSRWNRSIMDKTIKPWLATTAFGSTVTQSPNFVWAQRCFNLFRANAGMSQMFWSLVQSGQNLAGMLPRPELMGTLKMRHLRSGFAHALSGVNGNIAQVSKYMDDRFKRQIDRAYDDCRKYLDRPGTWWSMQRWMSSAGTVLNRATQNFTDGVVWSAAYEKAIEDIGSTVAPNEAHDEAVQRADNLIRRTQGDIETADVSQIEVGSAFWKAFMQFTSWAINQGNYNYNTVATIVNNDVGIKRHQRLFMHGMLAFAVPAIVAEAIKNLIVGPPEDDDPESYSDELYNWLLKPMAKAGAGMVPVYGQVGLQLPKFFDDKKFNDQLNVSPAIDALVRGTSGTYQAARAAISDDVQLKSANIRDVGLFLNMLLGIPTNFVGKSAAYLYDVDQGNIEPANIIDAVRGAATGRAWPGTKR